MKDISLITVSAPGCLHCKEFEEFWQSIETDWPQVTYQNIDVTTPEGQEIAQKYMILASPGIILNDELFATGGFRRDAFLKKLKELSE